MSKDKQPLTDQGLQMPHPVTEPSSQQAKERRKPDREIQMMARVDRLLATIMPSERQRVVAWLYSRYGSTT